MCGYGDIFICDFVLYVWYGFVVFELFLCMYWIEIIEGVL